MHKSRNAIEYFENAPHQGNQTHLINLCRALGFETQGSNSDWIVTYDDIGVGRIVGPKFHPDESAMAELRPMLLPLSPEQGEAADRCLFHLERYQINVHEAGHVVVARAESMAVCYARSQEDGQEVLLCRDHHDSPDALLKYYAAGAAAEQLKFGSYRQHGQCGDIKEMKALGCRFSFDGCVEEATKELCGQQSTLEAIATKLNEKGFLNHIEIDEILKTP